MRKQFLVLSFLLALCLGQSRLDADPIGNFRSLEGWSGFEPSSLVSPEGRDVARLELGQVASFEYTEENSYLSGEVPDFSDTREEISVGDWFSYRYIEFEVKLPSERAVEIELTVEPILIGRPDYVKSLSSKAVVTGDGWQKLVFALRDFDYSHHQGTFWKYIERLSIEAHSNDGVEGEVLVSQIRLLKSKAIALNSPVLSKPVKPGEDAVYQIRVENESSRVRQVHLLVESTAWEACPASLSEEQFALAPGETRTVSFSVAMNELVAPGGREKRKVTVVPDGRSDLKETLEFTTVRYLEHPYLLHTEAGWEKVLEKAETVDWAKEQKAEYLRSARSWRVPSIGTGTYCYKKRAGDDVLNCAIAWKLSGDEKLAAKVIQFLRDFTDPQTGYPTKLRCNDGAHVHRGMFMICIARAYDLLYNHEELTKEDHANIENTMRLYSRLIDWKVLTGDGNNHQAALVSAALLNALVLQDFAEVDRYLYRSGGYESLLGAGVLDDGHYFEGTANYNILTANIFNAVALAFEPWGIDVKNWKVSPKYGKFLMVSDWAMRGDFLGMSFERQGPATRNVRQLKDLWDAVLPMSDYRGVVFPTADSTTIDLTKGRSKTGQGFDTAYYLWRDPAYVPLLRKLESRDLLFGVVDLPESDGELGAESYVSDNVGFAVLRSKAEGRDPRERIQVVQRYGTHGGYHGHFDRTSLASLSRFGRTHYGPEASWYGYWSFMFKMWVQASSSHNMVVVDHRMQKPADNRRLLFHSGDLMQVSATEIKTEWIDPPYGGQTPYALSMPEEKAWDEARWLPTPENPRPQGDTGIPSEPILQRRLIIVTDDYVLMSDYLKGEEEHEFVNLFNCKGLVRLTAKKKAFLRHESQVSENPYSAAQFITAADWYDTESPVEANFTLDWSKGDMGGRQSQSEPGVMDLDYYSLWPRQADVMTANYPETQNVARHLYYKVIGDGKILEEGKFAPWILGKVDLDVDVEGIQTLEIETRVEKAKELKTIFLGNPRLLSNDGQGRSLSMKSVETVNIAPALSPDRDYEGGRVTLFGDDYASSIAAEPADRSEAGRIVVNLKGKNVSRFQATLGGDYPVGGDDIQRKVIGTQVNGSEARFLSAIEIREDRKVIKRITADGPNTVLVERVDGLLDTFRIDGLDSVSGNAVVRMTVSKEGTLISSESTDGTKRKDSLD